MTATPISVLLLRHGEQVREGDDGPLTARGRLQAEYAARAVAPGSADLVVSSSLRRSVETARYFGTEPRPLPDLDEFRFGPGWTWEQSDAGEDKSLWRPEHRAGGETLGAFEARVCQAFEGLLDVAPAGGRLILVVHSGVLDVLLRWALGATGLPWLAEASVAHASITELGITRRDDPARAPRLTEIRRLGDVAHLQEELRTGQ